MGQLTTSQTYRTRRGTLVKYFNGVKYYYDAKEETWVKSHFQNHSTLEERAPWAREPRAMTVTIEDIGGE